MGYEGTVEEYELRAGGYEELKKEFESYKKFTNNTIEIITHKNMMLEKKLDSISNIVEISKYINSNISNDNLIPMINDMIIGILGATYSSIYLKEDDSLVLKATNINDGSFNIYHKEYGSKINSGEPFVVSCNQNPSCKSLERMDIHSVIGVPVVLGQKYIGYIIVEHGIQDFFSSDHIKFITSIANQIAIALENSLLYKKVKENSIKDSLLKIYNRGYFFELVESKISNAPHKNFAIVMVDADDFKKANDVYGHQFGDEALCQIAKIISSNIDKSDIVARYGGEEIIIYIDDVHDRDMVFKKIENIRNKISDNILYYNDQKVIVTASFGISYYDEEHRELKDVLKLADLMMYSAKNSGKNIVISI